MGQAPSQTTESKPTEPPELGSELLMRIDMEIVPALKLGPTPHGKRFIGKTTGGTFEGEKIRGKVHPGGGDWYLVRPDGVGDIDVRLTLEADDGALLYVQYGGLWHLRENYLRITPRFETASEKHAWLNKIVTVGIGQHTAASITYWIYRIL